METLDLILLAALVVSALVTVVMARLLWAVIGLATVSALLSILMFRFGAPLAAVFELSVCAGLIPAILIGAVSLTRRLTPEELVERKKEKIRRFALLPVLVILAGLLLSQAHLALDFMPLPPGPETDVRNILWNLRHADLVGQIVILLGGALGVVVLLKGWKRES